MISVAASSDPEGCGAFETQLDEKAKNLYRERFLICVGAASEDDRYFVSARCSAEMKKTVVYRVDLSLDKSGVVNESQCECAVGMGPNAHCKHVQSVLFALVSFSQSGDITVQKTCT